MILSPQIDFAHFEKTLIDINDLALGLRYPQAIDFKRKLQKMRKVELREWKNKLSTVGWPHDLSQSAR